MNMDMKLGTMAGLLKGEQVPCILHFFANGGHILDRVRPHLYCAQRAEVIHLVLPS